MSVDQGFGRRHFCRGDASQAGRDGAQPTPESDLSSMASTDERRPAAAAMLTVLVITQEDPFYIPHFFRAFCRLRDRYADRILVKESSGAAVVRRKPIAVGQTHA